jgi:hypothetical protein
MKGRELFVNSHKKSLTAAMKAKNLPSTGKGIKVRIVMTRL